MVYFCIPNFNKIEQSAVKLLKIQQKFIAVVTLRCDLLTLTLDLELL